VLSASPVGRDQVPVPGTGTCERWGAATHVTGGDILGAPLRQRATANANLVGAPPVAAHGCSGHVPWLEGGYVTRPYGNVVPRTRIA